MAFVRGRVLFFHADVSYSTPVLFEASVTVPVGASVAMGASMTVPVGVSVAVSASMTVPVAAAAPSVRMAVSSQESQAENVQG